MKKINLHQVCSAKIYIKSVNTSYEYAKPRTNFKNYVENLIEREAVRLAKKKKNK